MHDSATKQLVQETQSYLDLHFCTKQEMAGLANISTAQLDSLIAAGIAPQPSYVVAGNSLTSAAFGELSCTDLREGGYYRRAAVPWVERAAKYGPENTESFFEQLKRELGVQLQKANSSIVRLSDSFDETGVPISEGLSQRLNAMVSSYSSGVFSICIAEVGKAEGIVRKEILQEKLQLLFDKTEINATESEGDDIIRDVASYADACMPFPPIEYPISSRKRLLEDLPARLNLKAAFAI